MQPCGMLPKIQINVLENGFENAWKQLNTEVKEILLPQKCKSCKYSNICHACAAMSYTETGYCEQVPEYVCQMSKNIYVYAEQRDGELQKVGIELIGEAKRLAEVLDQKVYAMLIGHNITDQAAVLIAHGADGVVVVEDPMLAEYVTEP